MAFFDSFPTMIIKMPNGSSSLVTDIIRNIQVPDSILNDPNLFIIYRLADNESPEMVSFKFYKTTTYHWLICLLNKRFDVLDDFPKSEYIIKKNAEIKYKDINGIHHYEGENGSIVDEFTVPRIPVTNYEHEMMKNEQLRLIKVLRPEFISEFVGMYYETIKQ